MMIIIRFWSIEKSIVRKGVAMEPLISVVIPMYNVEDYLEESINSILGQTYGNIEIILVDDASTDRTTEIALGYTRKYPFIRMIIKEKGEVGENRAIGNKIARGDYIATFDADDIAEPTKIAETLNFMMAKGIDVAVTYCSIFGEVSEKEKNNFEQRYNFLADEIDVELLLKNDHTPAIPTMIMKREVLGRVSYSIMPAEGDCRFCFDLLLAGYNMGVLHKPLVKVRKNPNSVTALRSFDVSESIKKTKLEVAKLYFEKKYSSSIWAVDLPRDYAIWCAGNGGRLLKKSVDRVLPNWKLNFFMDSAKSGTYLNAPIIRPEEIWNKEVDFVFITIPIGLEEKDKIRRNYIGRGLEEFKDFMFI